MIGKWVSPYIWTILLKCKPSSIIQPLYLVLKGYTLLDRVPRDAAVIDAYGVRIVPSGKLRLIDFSRAHHIHLVTEQ